MSLCRSSARSSSVLRKEWRMGNSRERHRDRAGRNRVAGIDTIAASPDSPVRPPGATPARLRDRILAQPLKQDVLSA